MRYLSIKHGYYPTDDAELAWEIDSVLACISDLVTALVKIFWEKDPAKKAKDTTDFFSGLYQFTLNALSNRLVQNGSKYIAGDKLTTADIYFGNFIVSVI